jgi:hypothetical protein
MGSTAVGRAFSSISDPFSQAWDRAFNGQARELEVAQRKVGEQEAEGKRAFDEQQEIKRKGKLTEQRNAQLAKVQAKGAMAGGRSSTILTDPTMSSGGGSAIYGGRKTLLGS